jgi:hypothetical protein
MTHNEQATKTLGVRATILVISIATLAINHTESCDVLRGIISTCNPDGGPDNVPRNPAQSQMKSIFAST